MLIRFGNGNSHILDIKYNGRFYVITLILAAMPFSAKFCRHFIFTILLAFMVDAATQTSYNDFFLVSDIFSGL